MTAGFPGADDLGFELIPATDDAFTVEERLAAAMASATDDPTTELASPPPRPYGYSWAFDWINRRFIRQGHAPTPVRELAALREWCYTAIYSARHAHAVFSDEFGMEHPDDLIGETDVPTLLDDFEHRIREALLVHDRITDVGSWDAEWDPATGQLTIHSFIVTTDDEEELSLAGEVLIARGLE